MKTEMHITLNAIRAKSPCTERWRKLLGHLGKTEADDEPLSLITVLESNGLDDALWCLCALDGHDREIRLFAVWAARQVQHLMKDERSIAALDVAERFANGDASEEELAAAWAAAGDAAGAAAWDAAWAAVGDAAGDAAVDTARAAAWAAAWAAAGDTAGDAAWAVAWDAAWAAVGAAAGDAAMDTARAAAWAAAWAAAGDAQAEKFRELFK